MRIGIIRYRYTPFGGAEVFLKRFMEGLLKRGHSVEVFASRWEEGAGVKVHRVRAPGPSFLKPLVFALNAKKAVEAASPDIVLSLERTFCQDIYRAGDGVHREWLIKRHLASGFLKRLSISINPLHRTLLYLEKRLFSDKRLKKVAANSWMVRDEIKRHYGLPDDKLCVIYNGVNLEDFSPAAAPLRGSLRRELGVGEDETLILFVGSGFERKGLIHLIRALKPLRAEGKAVKLFVIGKGRPERYRREARSIGLEGSVLFKGPVRETAGYYQAADIFALPSIYEPFSNACLEAMASGLPVVTSRANGAAEMITDGVNGAVIEDPADPIEIAGKIAPFLDRNRRVEAGIKAREKAADFTTDKSVDRYLALIDDVTVGRAALL